MNTLHDVDLTHVRRIAAEASTCIGLLGMAGERLLAVMTVLDLADDLPPGTPGFAAMMAYAAETLDEQWASLWDAVGVLRRPLPRLSPTRH